MTRRPSPEVESLTRENAILRRQIEGMRLVPGDFPLSGCADNSCLVAKPQGPGTNGGCRCEERKLRLALQWWRRRAEFLQITVQDGRDRDARADLLLDAATRLANAAEVLIEGDELEPHVLGEACRDTRSAIDALRRLM